MLNIIAKYSLFLLFFMGCSSKLPVTWQSRIIDYPIKALPLVYSEYGNPKNKTLVFLHGFGENRYTWRYLVPKLSQKYHLILLDLKGFGESPKTEDFAYSVYDQAILIKDFMQSHHLDNITLIGRSFGGGVALVLALMQEKGLLENKIEKMVLINSISYRQVLPSMLRTLKKPVIGYLGIHLFSNDWIAKEGYRYAFYNNALIPKESVDYASACLALPSAKYAYLETVNQLIPDDIEIMEKAYRDILLPTLIIWGRDDVSLSVRHAYRLHRNIQNSSLKIFPYVGHMPQEEAPKKTLKSIEYFMEEK